MYKTTLLLLTSLFLLGGDASIPGPQPARYKWVVGTVKTLTSQLTTTIYYGPWQCRQDIFQDCQKKCGTQYAFRGCIWLADIKFAGETTIPLMGTAFKGDRYAVAHCCCDYPKLRNTRDARAKWDNFKDNFRDRWAGRFGSWPRENGASWPGHHIHDLARGGQPTDENNIIPAPPEVHVLFNSAYPACYDGKDPWNKPGVNLPYTD